MHALCHSLNMIGQRAYITTFPQLVIDVREGAYTCPDLCTPIMTKEILSYFEKQGRSPIVVYLEAVRHNPLNATHIVRYALNYPGLLGGDTIFSSNEMVYAYSRRIAQTVGLGADRVLFMPVSDPSIFYPPTGPTVRSGSCFYASKYRDFHKGELFPITKDSVEITRYQPDSLTKKQIADLFRRSEIFYTYEDTALAIEAALCGCPTVFIPNKFLEVPLGFDDLGMDGFAWGDAPEEIARAKETVHRFGQNYQQVIERYWTSLASFASVTQEHAKTSAVAPAPITLLAQQRFHTITYAIEYIRQYGVKRFITKTLLITKKFGFRRMLGNTLRNIFFR